MIDLKEKIVLCTTKDEAAAILKEAEKQGIRWYDGDLATAYNPLIEHDGPIVLTFKYRQFCPSIGLFIEPDICISSSLIFCKSDSFPVIYISVTKSD